MPEALFMVSRLESKKVQKRVNLVDLVKSFLTSFFAKIGFDTAENDSPVYQPASHPRTSPVKFARSIGEVSCHAAGGVRHARQKSQPRLADAPVPKKKVPEWEKPDPDEEHPTKMLPLSVSLASKQSATCLF